MKRVAALFDMDHTLIWVNSGHSSVVLAKRMGLVNLSHLLKGFYKILLYRLTLLDIDEWYENNVDLLKGYTIEDMDIFADLWFNTMVKKHLYKEGVDLINMHREKGHIIAIVSNGPEFFVNALARALGITEVISTKVETENGRLTGRIVKPLCYGEGKLKYTIEWADANAIDLSRSFFYTDSNFDLPVMGSVGHPVAVNPDIRLRREAKKQGWPIMNFKKVSAF
jgi:putative phosphoserine phosphatase/1-acylglycerol-3-phosphate O-acyltransferase